MKIVITTSTGHVGSRVVCLPIQAGVRPTLLLRDPAKFGGETLERVDARQGDLRDAGSVQQQTVGADALSWVEPTPFTGEDPIAESTAIGRIAADAIEANALPGPCFSAAASERSGATVPG